MIDDLNQALVDRKVTKEILALNKNTYFMGPIMFVSLHNRNNICFKVNKLLDLDK